MFFNKMVKCFFTHQNSPIIPCFIIFIKMNFYTIVLRDKLKTGH